MGKKLVVFLTVLCIGFSAQTISAQNKSVESSSELALQISTLPEAKFGFTQKFRFPFLQGENPLTEGNNINLALTAEISPISLNGLVSVVWTPIAFFEFTVGGRIGTGWNVNLFGGNIIGIGLNTEHGHDGRGFDGLLWNGLAGGALQFDLAAIFPGDWNHVLFRSYHEINYAGYTRAKPGESWYFENDDGENINGFNYYGNYLIGYQMPIFLNMVAFLLESDLYLYNTPNGSQWGEDRMRWTFSGILNFAIHEQFDITVITQFRTRRNYMYNATYYRNLILDNSNPASLKFYSVAAVLTYKF